MNKFRSLKKSLTCLVLMGLSACGLEKSLAPAELDSLYAAPLTPPSEPLQVYHLGHSLVNREMPAMLQQMAGEGHDYRSQLGWGATLKSHWEPDVPINGFEKENAHAKYEDVMTVVKSGQLDAMVLTEMVEIKDAIKYFDSPKYVRTWARETRASNPATRVYLYETWHPLNDPKGWLARLDEDLPRHWEGELLAKGMAHGDTGGPVYVIPAGQVMARFVRLLDEKGGLPGLRSREDLFARNPDGTQDHIHLNDLGNYLVALTHYAVLYHRSPVGLPHRLKRADGTDADAPDPETALAMQEVVWEVVTSYPKTGVAQRS
ncbi:hypothetical protein [Hydrogenophaga laconesensis]|uniref:Lipoprotein n=1 Tax=Hydrogenophaga laconesensis TaxID=1805971 RepID=A0ABU1V4N9_9BURK|nr:hypothetical protein [Hydrogenophaga laconesensis]MDR7092360.1 hypothetical protein [Hydrogenophaga laconesensis]